MQKIKPSRVLNAWLVVGSLDILAAVLHFYVATGKDPVIVFQYISSAVLGPSAFEEGSHAILLGLGLHFLVALIFTITFFGLLRIFPRMLRYKAGSAILYGCFIWAVMRWLVLPLTKVHLQPLVASDALIGIGLLILCIGWPLVLIAKKNS